MMCEDDEKYVYYPFVTFENRTGITLAVCTSLEYPDTFLTPWAKRSMHTISNGTDEIRLPLPKDEIFAKTDRVQLFIYDQNVLTEAELDKSPTPIKDRHLELRRYELTRDWLEEHNWTVVYP